MPTRKSASVKCVGCGGEICYGSATGFCSATPECRSMVTKMAMMKRMSSHRKCWQCGGPLPEVNMTCYCRQSAECDRLSRQQAQRLRHLIAKGAITASEVKGMSPEQTKELADNVHASRQASRQAARPKAAVWTLADDGFIDLVAVRLTVNGTRRVALTDSERKVAIEKMIRLHLGVHEMKMRANVGIPKLYEILDELGWEVIRDPHVTGQASMLITRKDRAAKTLPPETPGDPRI